MSEPWPMDCDELRERGLVPESVECCSTCHDDADELGREPWDLVIDGRTYYVCCDVWEHFEPEESPL